MTSASFYHIFNRYFDALSLPRRSEAGTEQMPLDPAFDEEYVNRFVTRSGIAMIESDYHFLDKRTVSLRSGSAMIELTFCLQGIRFPYSIGI
jgi:AraC family transcriptional activator of pyochelin receptor